MSSSTDSIERRIVLQATPERVWRALAHAEEFGGWFGVDFRGKAFVVGQSVQGHITYPGYEHLTMDVVIERMEAPRVLSWRWHPAAIDPAVDYSSEPTTLVVFEIEAVEGGALLTVVESGLDQIPIARRDAVFRMNSSGWDEQMNNIQKHLDAA